MLSRSVRLVIPSILSVLGISGAAAAVGAESRPAAIGNWSAPASWSPAAAKTGSARPLSTQSDLTGALPFVAVTPCRQYDSRNSSPLADNTPRTISLNGAPCGLPSSIGAVSVNITIFSITGAAGNGVFKVGLAFPPTTAWINYPPSETQRANAGVVPVNSPFPTIAVQVNQGGGSVQFTVDVNGYYVSTLNNGEQFLITANAGGGAIRGVNSSGDGVQGQTAGGGSSGVYGNNTGGGKGVFGASTSGNGVEGQSTSGDGVHGHSAGGSASGVAGVNDGNGNGVFGLSAQGDGVSGTGATGVHGSSTFGWGVYGHSQASDGVHGDTPSNNSAGVAGINTANGYGVFGSTNDGNGVFGSTNNGNGVFGTATGNSQAGVGVHAVGTEVDCVPGHPICFAGSLALLAEGDAHFNNTVTMYQALWVVDNKNFVTPHPTDPTKQIAFVSLEGPESGTYFRGTGHLTGGYAEIDVPESFRLVTSPVGLSAVVTPVGQLATLAVISRSLDKIVVQGSADVEFDYVVNGVRAGYKNYEPIQDNVAFVPRSASDKTLMQLPDEAARRLKANGILNDDGTLNLETAHRLGWDQRPGWDRVPPTRPAENEPASTSH